MASTINTKIQLRTDLKANWESVNPVLKIGEIAIVCFDDDYKDIKIGNGLSTFNQLSYLYQNEIKTDKITGKDLNVKSIAQGYNVKATPTSLATGIFSYASGNFDVVHGIEAVAKEGDDYSFVFNGENLPLVGQNFYESHGEGSFNVNPKDGLSGFYIGEEHLANIFSNYFLSSEISNYYTIETVDGLLLDIGNNIISVDRKVDNIASNHVKLSSETTQSLSTNIDMRGFLKVGGITAQGRKFIEITKQLKPLDQQSRTMIGQTYQMISTDFINHYLQGHIYLLTVDLSDNLEYKDITDLNEMSVTYIEQSEDLRFESHVGSAYYDDDEQDLDLQILRM